MVAQQDRYQQLKPTLDGNIKEWQSHTHYAIVQPNGKVLGLLTPEGKLGWQPQAQSLWGLPFSHYNANPQLAPQLLFSGQYYDSESGLAYNRFRYYDPETANYLCTDPLGLIGGKRNYGYVVNPIDNIDPLGLKLIKLRHYTSNKGFDGIKDTMIIKAYDQNSVFATRAKGKPLSMIDVANKFKISPNHARNYIDFYIDDSRVIKQKNSLGVEEYKIKGDVILNEKTTNFYRRKC